MKLKKITAVLAAALLTMTALDGLLRRRSKLCFLRDTVL